MDSQNQYQPQQGFDNMQIPLPNATAVLVLGIISIVGCFCYGVPGLICAIIAMVLASRDLKMYNASPQSYTPGSASNLKAGRVCAIIGLSFSVIYFLIIVFFIATVGFAALTHPEQFLNQLNR